ncbi:uncharacterized protein L969DRAFT_554447 [Mixia osmundae IAM 14324]|uniref:uncharacterized protein n=1 Tax=Mixia osmundae (strain CBS 9802 / IAM 14324 / JCM 22182 / KY 12970) TaxID=764103 RepID=UPI0004A55200|nr:uncharacterized protein L969DRAFT_554447 [Mixia osmundae IAM 14324]KEI37889.1 hypothetical protein L969DRAFT_554447 [Mixia osmundae IAM 14324]
MTMQRRDTVSDASLMSSEAAPSSDWLESQARSEELLDSLRRQADEVVQSYPLLTCQDTIASSVYDQFPQIRTEWNSILSEWQQALSEPQEAASDWRATVASHAQSLASLRLPASPQATASSSHRAEQSAMVELAQQAIQTTASDSRRYPKLTFKRAPFECPEVTQEQASWPAQLAARVFRSEPIESSSPIRATSSTAAQTLTRAAQALDMAAFPFPSPLDEPQLHTDCIQELQAEADTFDRVQYDDSISRFRDQVLRRYPQKHEEQTMSVRTRTSSAMTTALESSSPLKRVRDTSQTPPSSELPISADMTPKPSLPQATKTTSLFKKLRLGPRPDGATTSPEQSAPEDVFGRILPTSPENAAKPSESRSAGPDSRDSVDASKSSEVVIRDNAPFRLPRKRQARASIQDLGAQALSVWEDTIDAVLQSYETFECLPSSSSAPSSPVKSSSADLVERIPASLALEDIDMPYWLSLSAMSDLSRKLSVLVRYSVAEKLDEAAITRLCALLGQCVTACRGLDPLAHLTARENSAECEGSARKRSRRSATPKKVKMSKSTTPNQSKAKAATDAPTSRLLQDLKEVQRAAVAIDLILSILTSANFAAQVYSEDLLSACISTLADVIMRTLSELLDYSMEDEDAVAVDALAVQMLNAARSSLDGLTRLLKTKQLSETCVLPLQYACTALLFAQLDAHASELPLYGATARSLQIPCLLVLQTIYNRHEGMRAALIEEAFACLRGSRHAKSSARSLNFSNGRNVYSASALFLSVVQSAAVPLRDSLIHADLTYRQKLSAGDRTAETLSTPIWDLAELECKHALALSTAHTISAQFINAMRTPKSPKTTQDPSSKVHFERLLSDLLDLVDLPDLAAPHFLIQAIVVQLNNCLNEADGQDNASLKAVAVESLGNIAARYCALTKTSAMTLDEILARDDVDALQAYMETLRHSIRSQVDPAQSDRLGLSALDFRLLIWLQQAAAAACISPEPARVAQTQRVAIRQTLAEYLYAPALQLGLDAAALADSSESDTDATAACLLPLTEMKAIFDLAMVHLLSLAAHPVIALRTKALRGIAKVMTEDPALFSSDAIQQHVVQRLLDSSSAVREAMLELVSKHLLQDLSVAHRYLPYLLERLNDTGLSVRKRAARTLKDLYPLIDDQEAQLQICARLVNANTLRDSGIQDMLLACLEDALLPTADLPALSSLRRAETFRRLCAVFEACEKSLVLTMRDLQRQLEDRLAGSATSCFVRLAETMLEELGRNESAIFAVEATRAVLCLVEAEPATLTLRMASSLLPLLRNTSSMEEQVAADYVLRIYRRSIPKMPKALTRFSGELQDALLPMINKPSVVKSPSTLQDLVACLCAIMIGQTGDVEKLCAIFSACKGRLETIVCTLRDGSVKPSVHLKAVPLLVNLVSLLCAHSRFDQLRKSSDSYAAVIDEISTDSITEETYSTVCELYTLTCRYSIGVTALQALGTLFQAFPIMLLRPTSFAIFDSVMKKDEPSEPQTRALRIMLDVLNDQADANAQLSDDMLDSVDLDKLTGAKNNFAESSIASALVQRYLPVILEACVALDVHLQAAAVDMVGYTVQQGLCHPMQCLATLIALESCDDDELAHKAMSMHRSLHVSHSNVISTRFFDTAREVFAAVSRLPSGVRLLREGSTLRASPFDRWYELLVEKRQWKLDFVRSLIRCFDLSLLSGEPTAHHLALSCFISDCLASLSFTTQEEPLTIMHYLDELISTRGMEYYHALDDMEHDDTETQQSNETRSMLMQSLAIVQALALRKHLELCYTLSDAKRSRFLPGKKSAIGDKAAVLATATIASKSSAEFQVTLRNVAWQSGLECAGQRTFVSYMLHASIKADKNAQYLSIFSREIDVAEGIAAEDSD